MKRALGIAVGFTVVCVVLFAVRFHEIRFFSGDEPHYLIVAESLLNDGDVDVKNDYALAPYRPFPNPPDAHVNTTIFTASSPHWYSSHGVGLAAIIVPGTGVDNARGAAAEMVLLTATVLTLSYFWARRFARRVESGIAAAVVGFSPFFLGLDGRIFPDLPTAGLLLGCLLLLELPRPRLWQLGLLSVLAGISPWIHFKNGLVFPTIIAVAAVLTARRSSGVERVLRLAAVVGPALLSAVLYELSIRDWYGGWDPARMSLPGREVFAFSPIRGLTAGSFDASQGIFTSNPAYLLILVGLPLWYTHARSSFVRFAIIVGPAIVVESTFNDWSGGYAPAGRYALQFVPVFAPAIAMALRYSSGVLRVAAATLIGMQWALAAAYIWLRPPWAPAGVVSPLFSGLKGHLGFDLDRLMPTFDSRAHLTGGAWQLAGWYAAAGAAVIYGASLSRRTPRNAVV